MFLRKKFCEKKDGAIRPFDFGSKKMHLLYWFFGILCVLLAIIMLFPAIWIFMGGFKDIKELNSSVKLWPEKINLQVLIDAWNSMSFAKYYLNSIIVVVGSVISSVFF